MKIFTKNFVLFALTFTLLTILCRVLLSHLLCEEQYTYAIITSIAYGVSAFALGWIFGKRDHEELHWFDIGFRFHCCTYLIFAIISGIWFGLGYNAPSEPASSLYSTLIIWGIFVVVHFIVFLITRKASIKGIKKNDVF